MCTWPASQLFVRKYSQAMRMCDRCGNSDKVRCSNALRNSWSVIGKLLLGYGTQKTIPAFRDGSPETKNARRETFSLMCVASNYARTITGLLHPCQVQFLRCRDSGYSQI